MSRAPPFEQGATCSGWKRSVQGSCPMAPQYAPSLRSRLAPLLLFLQIGFVVIFAFCIEIESNIKADGTTFSSFYPGRPKQ